MNSGLRLRAAWRFSPPALVGGAVLGVVIVAAAAAPLLAPYDPVLQDPAARLLDPSPTHLLGTDDFGRDIFTRILYGGRSVLLVGSVSVTLALIVGTLAGMLAGYRGGGIATVIMRATDAMLSIPLVLLAVIIVVALGPGLVNLTLAVAFSQVPIFTRLARSLTISVLSNEYVEAARSLGATGPRIVRAHILPNIVAPLIVQSTTTVALAILNSTALNFLGLGIQPPSPDWGSMISDFRRFVFDRPLLPMYPGLAIAITVLSLNLVGDGLARLIDPTQRKSLRQ